MRLIGLAGYKGSGKSTAAKYLREEKGFRVVPMASVLKDMLATFGLSERQIHGDLKEEPDPGILCGKSPRWAMQTLGTEWGRELIGDDVWIRAWWAKVEREAAYCDSVSPRPGMLKACCDDVRFANEAEFIRSKGGIIAMIERPGHEGGEHASEQLPFQPDHLIRNDGPVRDLHNYLDILVGLGR